MGGGTAAPMHALCHNRGGWRPRREWRGGRVRLRLRCSGGHGRRARLARRRGPWRQRRPPLRGHRRACQRRKRRRWRQSSQMGHQRVDERRLREQGCDWRGSLRPRAGEQRRRARGQGLHPHHGSRRGGGLHCGRRHGCRLLRRGVRGRGARPRARARAQQRREAAVGHNGGGGARVVGGRCGRGGGWVREGRLRSGRRRRRRQRRVHQRAPRRPRRQRWQHARRLWRLHRRLGLSRGQSRWQGRGWQRRRRRRRRGCLRRRHRRAGCGLLCRVQRAHRSLQLGAHGAELLQLRAQLARLRLRQHCQLLERHPRLASRRRPGRKRRLARERGVGGLGCPPRRPRLAWVRLLRRRRGSQRAGRHAARAATEDGDGAVGEDSHRVDVGVRGDASPPARVAARRREPRGGGEQLPVLRARAEPAVSFRGRRASADTSQAWRDFPWAEGRLRVISSAVHGRATSASRTLRKRGRRAAAGAPLAGGERTLGARLACASSSPRARGSRLVRALIGRPRANSGRLCCVRALGRLLRPPRAPWKRILHHASVGLVEIA